MVAVMQAQDVSYQDVTCIRNLSSLPARIRGEIQSVTKISTFGDTELTGDDDSGNLVWSAEGYWDNPLTGAFPKFVVTGYGSHSCHWDGQSLKSTANAY
jgi:hypothetical protein